MESFNNNSFLYNLLISPGYRILRHLILIILFIVISLGGSYYIYEEYLPVIGNKIFLTFLPTLLIYITNIYIYLYVFVPRFLLKKKFGLFTISLAACIIIIIVEDYCVEYLMYRLLDTTPNMSSIFHPDNNRVLAISSAFVINGFAATGLAMTVSLKQWMIDNQRLGEIEKYHLQTETERLKEQINPEFLFKMLNRTGVLSKNEPQQASEILMKLSRMLRYQLYDCARDKILLKAVINFLSDYLSLEQAYKENFNYTISAKGDLHMVFVPPLLFLPFVRDAVKHIQHRKDNSHIIVEFEVTGSKIIFTCNCENGHLLKDPDLTGTMKRLDLLYKDNYTLEIAGNNTFTGKLVKLELTL